MQLVITPSSLRLATAVNCTAIYESLSRVISPSTTLVQTIGWVSVATLAGHGLTDRTEQNRERSQGLGQAGSSFLIFYPPDNRPVGLFCLAGWVGTCRSGSLRHGWMDTFALPEVPTKPNLSRSRSSPHLSPSLASSASIHLVSSVPLSFLVRVPSHSPILYPDMLLPSNVLLSVPTRHTLASWASPPFWPLVSLSFVRPCFWHCF
ncbi:hypothetical protein LY78DRAFT_335553 [Colletotrichum sublineola]|nr:hypothetical protein LY78DRAFT_335553 [Colletotrichum sublineola]